MTASVASRHHTPGTVALVYLPDKVQPPKAVVEEMLTQLKGEVNLWLWSLDAFLNLAEDYEAEDKEYEYLKRVLMCSQNNQ